ncbi:MAG: [FeFe] hydrogenase H-cluster maturation GTPase HydF [Bacteroidales bacterium]|nr:[FeFe] hydrogenase H-cluster maturation GTPase HydF [Bacteroidales bacterium]
MGNENKPRIGIFGRRNSGKSSLINYLTGQQIAIVSAQAGSTTDPVRKSMEIGGVGPVVLIDTAGIDDSGTLGRERVQRAMQVLPEVDLAIILFTDNLFGTEERELLAGCRGRQTPCIVVCSQTDRHQPDKALLDTVGREAGAEVFQLTVADVSRREPLLELIRKALPETAYRHNSLLGDVIAAGDTVVMVTPIDSSAPEGRMILPQVQVLRDILDNHACAVVCRENELATALGRMTAPPRLVVTDSQVYPMVAKIVPDEVYLTSFSVVLARAKGLFDRYLEGARTISSLRDGDRVLLLESCTHNVTCEDIGRVKLPARLRQFTGKTLQCEVIGGASPIERPLSDYALVIQCGGCVVTPKQLRARLEPALQAGVPITNYGLALAYLAGILERSVRIFNR